MNVKRIRDFGYTARSMRQAVGDRTIEFDLTTDRRLIAERKARRLRHTGHWHAVASFWRQSDRYLGRTPDQVMRAVSRLYDEYVGQDGDAGADYFWGGDLNVVCHTPAGWVEVSPPAETLTVLATDPDAYVRWRVAINPNTPAETLTVLATDPDADDE